MEKRTPSIPLPQNVHDLRRLLNQYGGMLSPQNRSLIMEVIQNLENGADPSSLQALAGRVQRQAQTQQQQPRQQQQQQRQAPRQAQGQRPMPGQPSAGHPASNPRQNQRPGWR